MELGKKIKALRLKANVTQEALAAELGVSAQTISKYENDVCAPDISLLPRLSVYFGVTIDELFGLTVEQRLTRLDNLLETVDTLTDAEYAEHLRFLNEQREAYADEGRIEALLARLWHHRMYAAAARVSQHARKAMLLHPDRKECQWLLQMSEGACVCDWNARQHNRTIAHYRELVERFPHIRRNYLELMDNLLLDHRTREARQSLIAYDKLPDKSPVQVLVYEARIAFAEYRKEDAMRVLERLEREYPNSHEALFELAGLYADLCDYDKALTLYEQSYERTPKPRYTDDLAGIAAIHEITGQYDRAIAAWERCLDNYREEWGITEGSVVDSLSGEIARLRSLIK